MPAVRALFLAAHGVVHIPESANGRSGNWSPQIFPKSDLSPSIFSDHNAIKSEISNKDDLGN